MDGNINSIVVIPDGFKIRSKADAKRFLEELIGVGSGFAVKDPADPEMHMCFHRFDKGQPAGVAHEYNDKHPLAPDLMYDGQKAIDLTYRARKALNERFFKND